MLTTDERQPHGDHPGTAVPATTAAAARPVGPHAARRRLVAPVGRPGRRTARADPGHRPAARPGHPGHAGPGRLGRQPAPPAARRRPGGQPRRAARLVRNHARRAAHRDRQGRADRPAHRPAVHRRAGRPGRHGPGAQAGNRTRTPALLAAITTAAIPDRPPAATPAGTTPDSIQLSTWEWEGGQDGVRSQRAAASAAS